MLRDRITGVVLIGLIGASAARAQPPSPDPAPVPVAPAPTVVVEPSPARTPALSTVNPVPRGHKTKHKPRHLTQMWVAAHPTLAETAGSPVSGRAAIVSSIPASVPALKAGRSKASPIVLVLVFVLGSAILLFAAFKDLAPERLFSVPASLKDRRSEVFYTMIALLLGVVIGLLTTVGLQ